MGGVKPPNLFTILYLPIIMASWKWHILYLKGNDHVEDTPIFHWTMIMEDGYSVVKFGNLFTYGQKIQTCLKQHHLELDLKMTNMSQEKRKQDEPLQ